MMIIKYGYARLGLIFAIIFLMTGNIFAADTQLTLPDLITMAFENNSSIKIAEADKNKAYWVEKEAKSSELPVLSYKANARYYKPDPSQPLPDSYKDNTSRVENKILLSIPIYTGGRTESNIALAELNLGNNEMNIIKIKQQVQFDTTSAYYGLLKAMRLKEVAKETVSRLNEHLETVEKFFKAGTAAKIDILHVEVELADAEQDLIKAENRVELTKITLNNIIGQPLSTPLSVNDNLVREEVEQSLEEYLQYAEKDRPELIQARLNYEATEKEIGIAKSERLPYLNFEMALSENDDEFPGTDNTNWSIGIAAQWNFYDSGQTDARINQTRANSIKSKELIKQTKDLVDLQVRQTYLKVQEATKRIAVSEKILEKAQEDYRLALLKYKTGLSTSLDLLDYQVALTKSKTNYIQAIYDYNISVASLKKAAGILLE